jgi:hypothetical protein
MGLPGIAGTGFKPERIVNGATFCIHSPILSKAYMKLNFFPVPDGKRSVSKLYNVQRIFVCANLINWVVKRASIGVLLLLAVLSTLLTARMLTLYTCHVPV